MRKLLLTLLTAIVTISTQAETPAITMTTTTPVGSTFSFGIRANADNTPIQVDWGNGILTNYTIGAIPSNIIGALTGNTIKIYGAGINYLDLYNNKLTSLDVTNNPELTFLYCDSNQLTTLDVSKNTTLTDLYCGSNQLTTLDVTQNTALTGLNCNYNHLNTLDLSKNTMLQTLGCNNNQIGELDLSNKSSLQHIVCDNNQIKTLNLDNDDAIQTVKCYNNELTFSTLPIKQINWTIYTYSPQAKLPLPKAEYALNEDIDLSSQLTAGENTTVYTWKTAGGVTLVKDVDYTESNGVFAFLKQPGDYFYCEMTNATFPDLTLTTENISIIQTPAIIMTTTTPDGSTFSFSIETNADNTPIQVDWGNGTLENFTIGNNSTSITGTLTGSTINVYGTGIWFLNVNDKQLISLDVSQATALTSLHCETNQLVTIDVSKNTALRDLYCIGNQLTTLDVSQNAVLTYLYCYNNQLTSLDVSKNSALRDLYCSSNQLTALDVTQNTALTYLYCDNNQLNSLNTTQDSPLTSILCYNNQLRFNSLPLNQNSWTNYAYSPQAKLTLPKTEYELNEEIDLSSQLTAGSNTTVYTWKTAGGVTLVKDVDYTENNGVFAFLKAYSDSVYCEMNNATFPDLTLSSTSIKIYIPEPNVVLSTTKTIGGTFSFNIMASIDNTPISIDWGNGTTLNYTVGTESASIQGNLQGNTVRIWGKNITYLNFMSDKLTSLDIANCPSLLDLNCKYNQLSTIDITGNTELLSLDCLGNNLKAIDLSQNGKLEYLSCGDNKINALNISNDTKLTQLYCFGNNISSIDITNNTLLETLDFSDNQIKLLDISNNNALDKVKCYNNWFTFSSLPIKQASWSTYLYSPQYNYLLDKVYSPNEEINLSDQLSINGNTTLYIWKTKGGEALTSGTDYTENNGVFQFAVALSDSIYCEMTNASFPDLTLSTSCTAIQPVPSITIATAKEVGSQFMFGMEGIADNTPIQIDWGDGVLENYTVDSYYTGFSFPLKGNEIKIWGTGINYLDVSSKEVTNLNVSKAKTLRYLFCKNNELDTLNLSGCTSLVNVECTGNAMRSLILPGTSTLKYVSCENNNLTFATLPTKQLLWTSYTYSPQAMLPLPKKTYEVNEAIDLSSQLFVGNSTTVYTLKTTGGTTLVKDVDYKVSSGVFSFINTFMDSLYCEMTNASLPSLTLVTENIAVPVKPAITMTTTTEVGSTFSFQITANADNTPILVDWGNGTTTNYNIGTTNPTISGTLTGNAINIYGVGITKLYVYNANLTHIDVSRAVTLTILYCESNQLTTIDVSKNIALTELYCSNNQLTSLDLSKNMELVYLFCHSNHLTDINLLKNTVLTDLYCHSNHLTDLDVSKCTQLSTLECGSNNLSTLNIQSNTALTNLHCYSNELSSLDISNCTDLDVLNCSNNQLATLNVTQNTAMTGLYCGDNKLNINTLPLRQASWTYYYYTPQAKLTLPKTEYALNEEIDLSSQLTAGGNTTVYTWKTAGGVTLVKDVDYTESNGIFAFIKAYSDSVYCEMTNATFSDLTLETKNIAIYLPLPTISMVSASAIGSNFYFDINATENTQITVDFGDGSLSSYTMDLNSSRIEGTLSGDTVKIWGSGIQYIGVSWMELTSINISEATELKSLHCSYNQLTSIDLSNNIQLDHLYCNNNQLESLDLSNNTHLQYVYDEYNYLTFTSLPLINSSWSDYMYSPQYPIKLEKTEYSVGEVLDLSSQLNVNGTITTYSWVTSSGNSLEKNVDYIENNGKYTFLKGQAETIYCQMTNATFPSLSLETEPISVTLSSPCIILLTTQSIGNNFTFIAGATDENTYVIVDWGNGSTTNHTIGVNESSISGTLAGNTVKVFGNGITLLNVESKNLSALDVSGAISLQNLLCNNNQLEDLDISKNTQLQHLDCRINKLENLDPTKNTELTYLNCNSNQITNLDLQQNVALQTLDCQNNQLTTLDLTHNTSLQVLWCTYNKIATLNLSNNTLLGSLYCSYNELASLIVSNNVALTSLKCENNLFRFSTLPLKQDAWTIYTYNPQATVELAKKQYGLTETVDLSSELTVNSNTTNYVWTTKGGSTLVSGTDYNVTGGITTFLKVQTDSVYCQMTNASFPDLTLYTTNIKVSQFPLSVTEDQVELSIYPNPVNDYLKIEMPREIVRVEIYTMTGVKVFDNQYGNSAVTIPALGLPTGTLIVKVHGHNGVYQGKVIKI